MSGRVPWARAAALDALDLTLNPPGRDAQAALDQVLSKASPDKRDAALATELVYGTLRLGHRLNHVLSVFLRDPEGLPDAAVRILLVAAYEILSLKIPDYASVNWAVDRCKETGLGKLAGLANAVLRKVARLGNEVHEIGWYGPPSANDPDDPAVLSRYWSCPEWIVRLWLAEHGRAGAERLLRAQVLPPAMGLVALDKDAAGLLADHPALLESHGMGFAFPAGTDLSGLLGKGLDRRVARLGFAGRKALLGLGVESWTGPAWDACAGRGGKTRVLAELGLEVLATDAHQGRIKALTREQPRVGARVHSLLDGPPEGRAFPTVLVDAPCTGLGVLSRRPDIKWKRGPEDAADLVRIQADLLDAAWTGVAPGGRLAYLTCTLNRAENQDQAEAFLARTPDARLEIDYQTPTASPLGEFFYGASFFRTK